jgi:LCP family protein required for cell wall assembly
MLRDDALCGHDAALLTILNPLGTSGQSVPPVWYASRPMDQPPSAYQAHLQGKVDSFSETQPVSARAPRTGRRANRWIAGFLGLLGGIAFAAYLLAPMRTNVLLIGIDRPPEGTHLARSDTMILTTFRPLQGYVGMLSIPRDLWVAVPGVGENRINTAHFFAENAQPGSGLQAAKEVVATNFGVDVPYVMRIRFDGLVRFVDTLGCVEVDLPEAMSGYEAGRHKLDGTQALAFVRDRKGSDDFFRMQRGQLFLKAMLRRTMNPLIWPRLPAAWLVLAGAIDGDLPILLWPQLGVTLLRAGPQGIDGRTLTRDMVTPFTSSGGAAVLAPRWDQINPMLLEMFGQ